MLRVQNANCKVICSVVNCLTSTLEIFTCDGSEERELTIHYITNMAMFKAERLKPKREAKARYGRISIAIKN